MNSSVVGVTSVPTEDPIGCSGVETGDVLTAGTCPVMGCVASEVPGDWCVVGVHDGSVELSVLDTEPELLGTAVGVCCVPGRLSVLCEEEATGWGGLALLSAVGVGGSLEEILASAVGEETWLVCPKVVGGAVVRPSPLLLPGKTVCALPLVGAVLLGGLALVLSSPEPLGIVVGLPLLGRLLEVGIVGLVGIVVEAWAEVLGDVELLGWAGGSVVFVTS